jgi:hypothetical protein
MEMAVAGEASFNVAQTLAEGQLREDHAQELISGAEVAAGSRHGMELHGAVELLAVEDVDNLRENQSALVHQGPLSHFDPFLATFSASSNCVTSNPLYNSLKNIHSQRRSAGLTGQQ